MHFQVESLLKTNGSCTPGVSSSLLTLPANISVTDAEILVDKPVLDNEASTTSINDQNMNGSCDAKGATDQSAVSDTKEVSPHNFGNGSRTPRLSSMRNGEKEFIEQFEPGVYVIVIQLQNGTKIFKQVKFSKRRFVEQQAEEWWKENSGRAFRKYNHHGTDSSTMLSIQSTSTEEEEEAAAPPQS